MKSAPNGPLKPIDPKQGFVWLFRSTGSGLNIARRSPTVYPSEHGLYQWCQPYTNWDGQIHLWNIKHVETISFRMLWMKFNSLTAHRFPRFTSIVDAIVDSTCRSNGSNSARRGYSHRFCSLVKCNPTMPTRINHPANHHFYRWYYHHSQSWVVKMALLYPHQMLERMRAKRIKSGNKEIVHQVVIFGSYQQNTWDRIIRSNNSGHFILAWLAP